MKSFDIILWDIDGTLLDFEAAEKAAIRSLFSDFGFGECTDEMLAQYSAINKKYWNKLEAGELSKPQILIKRFEDFFACNDKEISKAPEFNAAYQIRLGDTIVFRDDSKSLISSLKGKIKQYAVSNGTVLAQTKKLSRSGLGELMDGIFLSEQIGYEKPAKEFFDYVFSNINFSDKSRILIVGDSLTSDIAGGNRAGIKSCWYNPKKSVNKTDYIADFEITDLNEIMLII